MLKPFTEAIRHYDEEEFLENILWFAANGFVHSDADCFMAGRLVHHSRIETESKYLIDTKSTEGLDKPDTWLVYVVSGNINRAFELVKPAKYLAFERFDNKLRLYSFKHIRRLAWAVGQKN